MKLSGIHTLLLLSLALESGAQKADYRFWVQFADKQYSNYSLDRPQEFLSARALERRARQGISLDEQDMPVSEAYLYNLSSYPLRILYTSRWMNAAVIETEDSTLAEVILNRPYVEGVECLYHPVPMKKSSARKWEDPADTTGLYSDVQIRMLQGQALHDQGYLGAGMIIAILDAGFREAEHVGGLDSLFENGRILGTRSFVEPDSGVFWPENGEHGTHVLSIMGGDIGGQYQGTAPKAAFWLIQTEDIRTEYRIEEANWLAGAELADSAGADVINCSLGYSTGFTDSAQNYTYQQMDGKSTLVARAAMLAASRGMLVVCSAGNSGKSTDPWGYITSPADGEAVLAVGAVDAGGLRATFSSRGPSADGRVKPDVMAQGAGTWLIGGSGTVQQGNGTSYSSPLIAGLTACLWQKYRDANATELLAAIRESASMNPWPDSLYGYGIPNFALAGWIFTGEPAVQQGKRSLRVYPNPADGVIHLDGGASLEGKIFYRICDPAGRIYREAEIYAPPGIKVTIPVRSLPAGSYIISLTSGGWTANCMFVKLR
jgi:serine protease AprX